MQFAMMEAADRDGIFVANLSAHCARLRKAKVMCLTGASTADNTGVGRDELTVLLITQPNLFGCRRPRWLLMWDSRQKRGILSQKIFRLHVMRRQGVGNGTG
jgi:hypothetical protein